MRRPCLTLVLSLFVPLAGGAYAAPAAKMDKADYAAEVCNLMQTHAEANKLLTPEYREGWKL